MKNLANFEKLQFSANIGSGYRSRGSGGRSVGNSGSGGGSCGSDNGSGGSSRCDVEMTMIVGAYILTHIISLVQQLFTCRIIQLFLSSQFLHTFNSQFFHFFTFE